MYSDSQVKSCFVHNNSKSFVSKHVLRYIEEIIKIENYLKNSLACITRLKIKIKSKNTNSDSSTDAKAI